MKIQSGATHLPAPDHTLSDRRKLLSTVLLFGVFALSACTTDNVSNGLRPNATIGNQTQPQPTRLSGTPTNSPDNTRALAPIDSPVEPQANQQTANLAASPGVSFLPVIGPPQSAVSQLSSAVTRYSKTNAITVIPGGQPGAKYQVKGYFSALDDGSGTRLIYIWDILDASGRNLHRISGEERTINRNADPWSAVDSNVINAAVDRMMQNFRAWLSARV